MPLLRVVRIRQSPQPIRSSLEGKLLNTLEHCSHVYNSPTEAMSEERRSLLDRRFREAARKQPDLRVLRRLLLGIGGSHLVAPPWPDERLSTLIEDGFVMAGPVVRRTMKESRCHTNIAEVWARGRHRLIGIGTGYSLSDDGLWRQHSWGLRREGILETTAPRVKYFGVLLQHWLADSFATANLAPGPTPPSEAGS